MNLDTIGSFISTIGFPIAACVLAVVGFVYVIKYIETKHNDELHELRDVVKSNTDAISAVTLAVNRMLDKMDK